MTPKQIGDEWFVMHDREQLAGPFKTNGEAWRWIDRRTGQAISRAEARSEFIWSKISERAR
jgi:hypothetical protein